VGGGGGGGGGGGAHIAQWSCVSIATWYNMARFGRWPLAWRKIWAVSMFDLAVEFVALFVG